MSHSKLALASLVLAAFFAVGCSLSTDSGGEVPGTRISQAALKSGCRVVCPKCHKGQMCSYECHIQCPPAVTPCGDNVCRHGEQCCNPSCGTCVAPGGVCSQIACASQGCVQTAMCEVGYKWSKDQCACVPDKPAGCVDTKMCKVGYEWSTTACACVPKQSGCVDTKMCMQGYTWSQTQCACVPSAPTGCVQTKDCMVGYKWSQMLCACVPGWF